MIILDVPTIFSDLGAIVFNSYIGLIIPIWALIMILLERIFPYTPNIKLFRRGFWLDLVWYTIIQSYFMQILIFDKIIHPIKLWSGIASQGIISHWNFGFIVLFFFITHDFYIYWFHRLQHNNKYLWRTHEAHHSVREVDFIAGSRSHFLEILINQTIEFLPIFLLLDAETALYVVPIKALLDALWGMWIHSNIAVNTGKLQYIINGPEMHQWHHANHEEVFYKNYSTKLAIWDWLFGTGFLPKLKPLSFYFSRPKMFGLPYAYPRGFFTQTVYALVRFDFYTFESKTIYAKLLDGRKNWLSYFAKMIGISDSWISTTIFDQANTKYNIDTPKDHLCNKCSQLMKYYYQKESLVERCEHCESNVENLAKFN